MSQQIKIPLWIAILMNINIIMGAAFFLVASQTSTTGPIFAPLSWLSCALVLLPLVIVFAKLAQTYPSAGGLYVYSHHCLGPIWGFISGWGYYIGCAAINALILHAFCLGIQSIPYFALFLKITHLDGLLLDVILLFIFTLLNLLNVTILERFQIGLVIFKLIPILVVVFSVPFLCNASTLVAATPNLPNLFETIPSVFLAYIGIEACCSIADKIQNGKKNASKAIYISFALTAILYAVIQLSFILVNGTSGAGSFFTIIPQLTTNPMIINWGNYFIHLAILFSYLGGFYGMFYFNNWNLQTIAKDKNIIFWATLSKLNKNGIPWACVLTQSTLIFIFLLFTGQEHSLTAMGDFGTMIAYLLSVISFLTLYKKLSGYLALISSFIFMYLFTKNLLSYGLHYLLPFLGIIGLGILAYKINEYKKNNDKNTLSTH